MPASAGGRPSLRELGGDERARRDDAVRGEGHQVPAAPADDEDDGNGVVRAIACLDSAQVLCDAHSADGAAERTRDGVAGEMLFDCGDVDTCGESCGTHESNVSARRRPSRHPME